ncbi:hypothetical protein LB507_008531, partial [Fusarium sp. FIESC RH6]
QTNETRKPSERLSRGYDADADAVRLTGTAALLDTISNNSIRYGCIMISPCRHLHMPDTSNTGRSVLERIRTLTARCKCTYHLYYTREFQIENVRFPQENKLTRVPDQTRPPAWSLTIIPRTGQGRTG